MIDVQYAYELFKNKESYTKKTLIKAMFENNIDRMKLFTYFLSHGDKDSLNQMNITEYFIFEFIHLYVRDNYQNVIMYNASFAKKLIKFYKYIHTISLDELSKEKKCLLLSHSVLYLLASYKELKIPKVCFKYFIEDLKQIIKYNDSSINHFIGLIVLKKTIIERFHKLGLNEIDEIFKSIYFHLPYCALADDNELYYEYFSYYWQHTKCLNNFYLIFSIANDEDKIKLFKKYKKNLNTTLILDILNDNEKLPIKVEDYIIDIFYKEDISYIGELIFHYRSSILKYQWSEKNKKRLNALYIMYELKDI